MCCIVWCKNITTLIWPNLKDMVVYSCKLSRKSLLISWWITIASPRGKPLIHSGSTGCVGARCLCREVGLTAECNSLGILLSVRLCWYHWYQRSCILVMFKITWSWSNQFDLQPSMPHLSDFNKSHLSGSWLDKLSRGNCPSLGGKMLRHVSLREIEAVGTSQALSMFHTQVMWMLFNRYIWSRGDAFRFWRYSWLHHAKFFSANHQKCIYFPHGRILKFIFSTFSTFFLLGKRSLTFHSWNDDSLQSTINLKDAFQPSTIHP